MGKIVRKLSQVDAAFLRMDTLRAPMHVGCLMTFKLPARTPQNFFRDMVDHLRSEPFMPEPFCYRLAGGKKTALQPAWEEVEADMDYHVRHSALPKPGGERELGVLVARLHSHAMDFSRPLWECHIIEGLENRRFAIYFKAHHCAIDGMGAMRLTKLWLRDDPKDMSWPGGLEREAGKKVRRSLVKMFGRSVRALGEHAKATTELTGKLMTMARGQHSTVRASIDTPETIFNVPVTQQRRLGTQLLELSRFKALSKALEVTVNDVTLAVCAGAVQRYLKENGELPAATLNASVPIGLQREEGDSGNAVAGFVCPLGTHLENPVERVKLIHASTTRAKDELSQMSRNALEQFTLLGLAPLMGGQMTGTLSKIPPMFNFVLSNVVLTKHKLYLRGAELESMYPMSILFDGYAMNVTVIGYGDNVCVGFIGCRDAIPHLQNLAVYTRGALEDLEAAAGL